MRGQIDMRMHSQRISRQPMDAASRKTIALIHVLWASLVVVLALLILASFLTSSIPHWMGLLATVAETALAPIFIR
jgi:hypothetical protein